MRFADIGSGNIAASSRVLAVASADSAPIRRMMQEARDRAMLVDCCAGKKCKSVIVTDSGLVLTSALATSEIKEMLG